MSDARSLLAALVADVEAIVAGQAAAVAEQYNMTRRGLSYQTNASTRALLGTISGEARAFLAAAPASGLREALVAVASWLDEKEDMYIGSHDADGNREYGGPPAIPDDFPSEIVRAALAASPSAGVDVERLARALHEAKIGCWGPETTSMGEIDSTGNSLVGCNIRWNGTTPSLHDEHAKRLVPCIAAAYAQEKP